LRAGEDARPFRRWRLNKLVEEFWIVERVEVEIRKTQDDSDVRLPDVITGMGLDGCWASTRTTHQEYKKYEY
jgi:hypothetical protein